MPDRKPTTAEEATLEELRNLLLGQERAELKELRDVVNGARLAPEDIGRILPAAVRSRAEGDQELTAALTPAIESAIEVSVKRNPAVLVDAIFPVIGPAIRKSIREALAGLTETINTSIEHSFSPKGLRWRFDAWRTGVPFSEVVLKNSIVYRVEQAFLIHRSTGLLLAHATSTPATGSDPDMVSAMLSAIESFVSDSFEGHESEGIGQVEFGAQLLEVAHGPTAILACVVRGSLPASFRTRLRETLEDIHSAKSDLLRDFDGDTRSFEDTQLKLEQLLVEERPKQARRSLAVPIVLGLGFSLVLVLVVVLALRSYDESQRWQDAREALAQEPGLITLVEQRTEDGYLVGGLRDPHARDPLDLLDDFGIARDLVEGRWAEHRSDDVEIVRRRTLDTLALQHGGADLHVSWDGLDLALSGRAPHALASRIRDLQASGALVGLGALDLTDLRDHELDTARAKAELVRGLQLSFAAGSSTAPSGLDEAAIEDLAAYCAAQGIDLAFGLRFEPGSEPGADLLLQLQRREHLEARLAELAPGATLLGHRALDPAGSSSVRLLVALDSKQP
ncbi:MAG: hypothetical protein P1V81_10170 [Planctomycetota bacterium]|nr:hypothetical protein [Planctomycetota bacterium]